MKIPSSLLLLVVLFIFACGKTNTVTPTDGGNTVVTIDSSEFNGRLFVTTYDYQSGNKIGGTDVYIYTNYEDIKRRLFLHYKKTNTSNAEADFGYLLQGNYYIVSNTINKYDTSLVQILSKRIIQRSVYLQ
jgi:hypothetical protein